MSKVKKQVQEENYENEPSGGGFISYILFIAILLGGPELAYTIPWNKEEWIDAWNYVEIPSGFFLRSLKVIVIIITAIAWIYFLYLMYMKFTSNKE